LRHFCINFRNAHWLVSAENNSEILTEKQTKCFLNDLFRKNKISMVWYCVEERDKPISEYGRFRRRFLDGNKFSIYSHTSEIFGNFTMDRLEINKVKKLSSGCITFSVNFRVVRGNLNFRFQKSRFYPKLEYRWNHF